MTTEEKTRLLENINYFIGFVEKELGNPQADLEELEARFLAFLKNYGRLEQWFNYQTSALSKLGVPPPWSINQPEYKELLPSFLKIFRSEIEQRPATELVHPNMPIDELKQLVDEYEQYLEKKQTVKNGLLELIKKHNDLVYAQLVTKLPDLEPNTISEAAKIILIHYQNQKTASVITATPLTKDALHQLAQDAVNSMRSHFTQLATTGSPEISQDQAANFLKISSQRLLEAASMAIASLEENVPVNSWVGLSPLDKTNQVASITTHLQQGLEYLNRVPKTGSFIRAYPQALADTRQIKLGPRVLLTIVSTIINIQRFHPDVKKIDSVESISILITGVRETLRQLGVSLSNQEIMGVLILIYDSPHAPDRTRDIRNTIQATTLSNIPPLWETKALSSWFEQNYNQLTRFLAFWGEYFKSPTVPKNQTIPNKNWLTGDLQRQYQLLLDRWITAKERGPFIIGVFQEFRNFLAYLGSSGQVGLNSFLNGIMRLPSRLNALLTTLRLASFESAVKNVAGSFFLKYKVVFYFLIGVLIFMFTSGVVMPGTPMGKFGYVRTALLPPPTNVFIPKGAVPWVPPGEEGSGDYIPPEGCDPQYSDSKCCVPNMGYCSMSYLEPYFGRFGTDDLVAASKICFKESIGGLTGILNDSCLPCKPVPDSTSRTGYSCSSGRAVQWPIQSVDYSVGLFQINLIADGNCGVVATKSISECNSVTDINSPLMQTGCCKITNTAALEACYQKYSDPVTNILRALSKVKLDPDDTIDWYPTWGAAKTCGYD